MEKVKEILTQLAPYSILVGSAARTPFFGDIDLVVNAKGLSLAKKIFPKWHSIFIGQVTTSETEIQIEAMRYWYGPQYSDLKRKKKELTKVKLFDVEFTAWPVDTRETNLFLI